MFSNGIQAQTHSGNLFIDAELVYRQEQMLEAARDAGRARQARTHRTHPTHRTHRTHRTQSGRALGRLRSVLHLAA